MGDHSHMIGGAAFHAKFSRRFATPEIATADDDGNLHAERKDFFDPLGNVGCFFGINTGASLAG